MHVSRDVIVIIIMLAEITCVNKNFSLSVFFFGEKYLKHPIFFNHITFTNSRLSVCDVTVQNPLSLRVKERKKERRNEKKVRKPTPNYIFSLAMLQFISQNIYFSLFSSVHCLLPLNYKPFSRSYRRSFNICPREIYIHSFIFVNGYWRKISFFAVFFLV